MRYWRGMVAAASLVVCLVALAVTVRSFIAADSFTWTNSTRNPLPPEMAGRGNFLGVIEGRTVEFYRGRARVDRQLLRSAYSRWDEEYERRYVDRPQWIVRHHRPADVAGAWRAAGFWGRLGFEHDDRTLNAAAQRRRVAFPLWPVALVTAVYPIAWLRQSLRLRHRRRKGLCPACGYDLRASPAGCPECGTGSAPPHDPPTQRVAPPSAGAVD